MTAYDDIRAATTAAEVEHGRTVEDLATATKLIDAQAERIEALKVELAECQAGHPPDPPTPTVQRVGGCPPAGGFGATAAQSVITKWGTGASVRVFSSSDLRTVAARPPDASRVHASWKPLGGQPMTETSVRAACVNLLAGDMVTVEHEADVKFLNAGGGAAAQADLDERKRLQTEFDRLIKVVRPDLRTVCVLAGWRFRQVAVGDQAPDKYLTPADLLGVDLDGVNTSYYDFRQCLPRIQSVTAEFYEGWTCPEFGWPRQANDASGAGRVAAINVQAPAVLAAGAIGVEFFDYGTYTLTLVNERAAWQAIVDQYD